LDSINKDSHEEADKLFIGHTDSGKVTMSISKTFLSIYFGMFVDKFAINWMVNFDEPQAQ
jgi:PhnB protein